MNIWFTLHMDLANAEGPGWYLSALREDDPQQGERASGPVHLIPPTRLAADQARYVSEALDDALLDSDKQVAPSQIVDSGVHLIHEAIMRELIIAEEAAARAAKLKALQEAESPTDKDVTDAV